MTNPTFDADGYPTEETLEYLRGLSLEANPDYVLGFVARAWHYGYHAKQIRRGRWVFATCGWSGNEDLMGALRESLFWHMGMIDSLQFIGGLTIITTTPEARAELREVIEGIVRWAWKADD